MPDHPTDRTIRSHSSPRCLLCDCHGDLIYNGLEDRLYGVPGKWNLKKCASSSCGLIWLDPMPIEEDIGKAYLSYFTHRDSEKKVQDILGKKRGTTGTSLRFFLRGAYKIFRLFHDIFVRVTPINRERRELSYLYLDRVRPGRLLEVGCGDGSLLAEMQRKGWHVIGQEVDPKAAAYARSVHDVPVYLGSLEQFLDGSFNAVVMNHVIEHVHDPIGLLKECQRVLDPGGLLVVITPNSESFSHAHFKSDFYLLDPPRHLFLFNKLNLKEIAHKGGFMNVEVHSTAARADWVAKGSLNLRYARRNTIWGWNEMIDINAVIFQFRAWKRYVADKTVGEECVLRAIKQKKTA